MYAAGILMCGTAYLHGKQSVITTYNQTTAVVLLLVALYANMHRCFDLCCDWRFRSLHISYFSYFGALVIRGHSYWQASSFVG